MTVGAIVSAAHAQDPFSQRIEEAVYRLSPNCLGTAVTSTRMVTTSLCVPLGNSQEARPTIFGANSKEVVELRAVTSCNPWQQTICILERLTGEFLEFIPIQFDHLRASGLEAATLENRAMWSREEQLALKAIQFYGPKSAEDWTPDESGKWAWLLDGVDVAEEWYREVRSRGHELEQTIRRMIPGSPIIKMGYRRGRGEIRWVGIISP